VPGGAELWYDDRDIPFLQADDKDRADIMQAEAIGMRQDIEAGWLADSVLQAWLAGDRSLLKHSGLFSVQLQAPGSKNLTSEPPPAAPTSSGDTNKPVKGLDKAPTPAIPPKREIRALLEPFIPPGEV
jgi:hypothetical protein